MKTNYAAIVVAVVIVSLVVIFGFQLLGQAAVKGGGTVKVGCFDCPACTGVCVDNKCVPTGRVKCGDGRCVSEPQACNCTGTRDPCFWRCIDGQWTDLSVARVKCDDGRCITKTSEDQTREQLCQPCTQECDFCQKCVAGVCSNIFTKLCDDGTCISRLDICTPGCTGCDPCTQMCSIPPNTCEYTFLRQRCPDGRCIDSTESCTNANAN